MSKCNKSKNPCKICLSPVTQKTGLQCQGACASWVHYNCLNYTPGKIKDIKAGIIKVTCPCPDCKTTMPKEFRTDLPYSCNNSMCPANQPPKCDNSECPTNRVHGGPPMLPSAPPCPLNKCGTQCKQFSNPLIPDNKAGGCPPQPCTAAGNVGAASSSDTCMKTSKCGSGCSSTNDVSGDFGSGGRPPNFAVVEKMCNTVGELTNQIKQLMCQMQAAANQSTQKKSSPQLDSKSICPKPCFCPGNPARRP